MRPTLSPHFTRLIAKILCWVMLSVWAAGAANACGAPGAGAALSVMAARVFHGETAPEALASPVPCHVEPHEAPGSSGALDALACETLCETGQDGRVTVKGDMPSPLKLALPMPEPWWQASPSGAASQRLERLFRFAQPPSPPVAILFLRLTI